MEYHILWYFNILYLVKNKHNKKKIGKENSLKHPDILKAFFMLHHVDCCYTMPLMSIR